MHKAAPTHERVEGGVAPSTREVGDVFAADGERETRISRTSRLTSEMTSLATWSPSAAQLKIDILCAQNKKQRSETKLSSILFQNRLAVYDIPAFFSMYKPIELAFCAIPPFVYKRTLHYPAAERSGDCPTCSSSVFPVIDSVNLDCSCRRAFAKFCNLCATRFSATFLELPTICH